MLPSDIKDREHKKFVENASGDVTVRVTAEDLELGAVEITDGRDGGTDRAAVDWDGTYNALAVMDSRMKTDVDDNAIAKDQVLPVNIPLNYGYDTSGAFWSRFLVETDNDAIPAGQITQLVIPLNYYYEAKTSTWKRWQGESGSMWTTVVGL